MANEIVINLTDPGVSYGQFGAGSTLSGPAFFNGVQLPLVSSYAGLLCSFDGTSAIYVDPTWPLLPIGIEVHLTGAFTVYGNVNGSLVAVGSGTMPPFDYAAAAGSDLIEVFPGGGAYFALGGSGSTSAFETFLRSIDRVEVNGSEGSEAIDVSNIYQGALISGGGGDDQIIGSYAGHNDIDGGAGNDIVSGGGLHDVLEGGAGDDIVLDNDGVGAPFVVDADTLRGGAGDDYLASNAGGGDLLDGGDGNDRIDAYGADHLGSTLLGGAGDDTLSGVQGNDTLDGGDGIDTAEFGGPRSNFTIVRNSDGSITVTDSGADGYPVTYGSDTLTNIEFVQIGGSASVSVDALLAPLAVTAIEGGDTIINADEMRFDGLTLSGTVGYGWTITISEGADQLQQFVSFTDAWETRYLSLSDGAHTLTITAVDPSGQLTSTTTQALLVDTVAPIVAITSMGGTVASATQTVAGIGEADTTVAVMEGTTQLATATVAADGSWSTSVTLSGVGSHSLVATNTDAAGNTGTSAAVIFRLNTPPTGAPAITGTATEDQVLVADTSAIADADGLGSFSYQWNRNGAAVADATGATYTLGDADVGTDITVTVTYTDAHGTAETLTSAATGTVANVNDAPTGALHVSFDSQTASTATFAVSGAITDVDVAPASIVNQWQVLNGATWTSLGNSSATLTTDASLVGKLLRVAALYGDPDSPVASAEYAMAGDAAANTLTSASATAGVGTGPTILVGLGGNDVYRIGQASDVVIEAAGGGTDYIVSSAIDIDLANYANVEGAQLQGSSGHRAIGTANSDFLHGDFAAGANQLIGHGGNDIYTVDASDTIVEVDGGGVDTVRTSLSTFALDLLNYDFVENATALGTSTAALLGDELNNTLNGQSSTGANVLTGRAGSDTYLVGANDTVIEAAGAAGGTLDQVGTSSFDIVLSNYANVEGVFLTGASTNSATGRAGADYLDGQKSTGANNLVGLAGNDIYTIGAGDWITEAASGGTDKVRTSTLAVLDLEATGQTGATTGLLYANVENLQALSGAATTLKGNAGSNVLDGQSSTAANHLYGRGGNDIYDVGAGDVVHETAADGGSGSDAVRSSTVSLDLAEYLDVEQAILTGNLALDLTAGATRAATLTGNGAHNVLTGSSRSDALVGGGGADDLFGGSGADRFIFKAVTDSTGSATDIVHDFSRTAGDKIDVSAIDAIFGGGGANDAFSFHTLNDATPIAIGDMRQHLDVDGTTLIVDFYTTQIDTADMTIKMLARPAGMSSTDFLL